jgi:capsular polysaccharide transport system ATP-binding protein
MIEIRNLYKRYHNHHGSDWILKDINLTIPKGVSVGLIGANGAGKSTLLRLIAGMDSPDRGEVVRHCRVSWPIGLAGGFQGSMTGRQNVKFVARALGGTEKEMHRIIRFVEEFAEIGEAFNEPVRTYSSGMRSRLSFGLSLAFEFDVYISDEATSVGDLRFRKKATAAFKEKIGKASIIIVSHSEGILRELCDAGIWVENGIAHWFENVDDAIEAYHESMDDAHREENRAKNINEKQILAAKKQMEEARGEYQKLRDQYAALRDSYFD